MELTPFEYELITKLKEKDRYKVLDLSREINQDQSKVMRTLLSLKDKGLIDLWEQDEVEIKLTDEGKKALNQLPEESLILYLKERGNEVHIKDLRVKDKDVAIAWAKKKNAIAIDKGIVKLINENIDLKEKDLLKKVSESKPIDEKSIDLLKKRKFIEVLAKTYVYAKIKDEFKNTTFEVKEEVSALTPEIIRGWKNYTFKRFDVVNEPPANVYCGKEHPVNQVIEYVRKIWLDMGFKELKGSKVVQAFWNFDALFTPQDHPAREMQDTFYLDYAVKDIDAKDNIIKRVKEMHEKGDERSEGWGYKWKKESASQLLLRTHTTVLSALKLAEISIKDLPAKYFAIGKVFRNETLDWKHLFEFYQVEGFVASNDVNFTHLLGYLKAFFKKMGYDKIRVRPAYFPYTELSLEIEVFMHDKGWVELAGAGMFRPEVVKPLIGKEVKVLAWGLGLERIIMNYYGFEDIRDVYTTDVQKLRELKRWFY